MQRGLSREPFIRNQKTKKEHWYQMHIARDLTKGFEKRDSFF